MFPLRNHTSNFIDHASRILNENGHGLDLSIQPVVDDDPISSVLLLIGQCPAANGHPGGPCLILNKRSRHVKQAGDLCFPGGGISPRKDTLLASLLRLPGMPLSRWPYWSRWRRENRVQADLMALFFAIGLRESFEEMRLNPFAVKLVGPLPSQRLKMFRRIIYPVAAWVPRQKRFFPNWEVEKIVPLPLGLLLQPQGYLRCRLIYPENAQRKFDRKTEDFPCFRYDGENGCDLLWGATYRIVATFLKLVCGFRPPPLDKRPLVTRALTESYLTGAWSHAPK